MSVYITSEIKASFHVITTIVVKFREGCDVMKKKISFRFYYMDTTIMDSLCWKILKRHEIITVLASG